MVLDAQTDVTAKGTSLKRAGSQTEFASAVQDMGARIAQNVSYMHAFLHIIMLFVHCRPEKKSTLIFRSVKACYRLDQSMLST